MSSTLEDFVTSLKKKSPFFEPNWMEAKDEESGRPASLVIFVVAKLDPNSPGKHYPLAVVRRDCGLDPMESIQGGIVLGFLQRIIAFFSDPANYSGIQSELSLAAQFYQVPENALPQTELPDTPFGGTRLLPIASECERGMREFPFISTCLELAVAPDRNGRVGLALAPVAAPLGTVFRDTNMEYAMAAVDISELAAIRYGIFAFRTTVMICISEQGMDSDGGDGCDSEDWGERVLKLEENRTREPLSAAAYMAKFRYADKFPFEPCNELIDMLGRAELIDPVALERIWPRSATTV